MAKTILSEKDLEILAYAQFNADESVVELAKRCQMKAHVVRRAISNMTSAGIVKPFTVINFQALGYTEYYLWFSLGHVNPELKSQALTHIKNSKFVWFLAELNGDFQFWACLLAQSAHDLIEFFNELGDQCGLVISQKELGVGIRWRFYGRKFFSPKQFPLQQIVLAKPREPILIDDIDRKILLGTERSDSTGIGLARILGLPGSTIDYRLKRLRQLGVIAGRVYASGGSALKKIQKWELLLHTRGVNQKLTDILNSFAGQHRNITNLTEMIGGWDYQVTVEGFDDIDIGKVRAELERYTKGQISAIKSFTYVNLLKLNACPFSTLDENKSK